MMSPAGTEELLSFKADLKQNGDSGVALDIDGTLSWTGGFLMSRMQQLFGNDEGLSVTELIAKYKYSSQVPYPGWKSPEGRAWLARACSHDATQTEISPIDGASEGVNAMIQAGVRVVAYMTARPRSVLNGTKQWLRAHGFPDLPVLCKPDSVSHADANLWKGLGLGMTWPEVRGIVDDNPAVLAALPQDYLGSLTLIGHPSIPGGMRPDVFAQACLNWRDVVACAVKHLDH